MKIALLLSLLAAAASAARAAELAPLPPAPAELRQLSWEDCVALAAQRNPSLVSAQYSAQASRSSYLGSFNRILPSLSLSNSYSSSKGSDGRPGYSASATASVDLFNMSNYAGIRSASAGLSQAEARLRQTSANLRFGLRQAFVQALTAEKTVDVARKILDIRQHNAESVSLKYQSGKEYKGNMLNAQAQLLQSQASLAAAQRNLRVARRGLAQQLGVDEFTETAATGTLTAAAPPGLPPDMGALASARPDVLLQEAAIRSQKASVASAQSALWPSLSASYSRSRSGSAEFPPGGYSWSAGATLSLPIFGGGPTASYFSIKGARQSLEKSQQDLRSVRNSAVVDLEGNWASYAGAHDQLQVAQASLEAARQRNDEASIRYASGLLSFDNWELIVGEWVSAEQSAVQARSSAATAQAAWEQSLGKALGE